MKQGGLPHLYRVVRPFHALTGPLGRSFFCRYRLLIAQAKRVMMFVEFDASIMCLPHVTAKKARYACDVVFAKQCAADE